MMELIRGRAWLCVKKSAAVKKKKKENSSCSGNEEYILVLLGLEAVGGKLY
jgi:hypothetical protein